jgi:23S rRNA A2030 N6-methylase RlmJ
LAKIAYDHGRKAGNRGDVWKHFALVTVIEPLVRADAFRYIDTHSGAPLHRLGATGEWRRGIGEILNRCTALRRHGYVETVSEFVDNKAYPSAWWLVVNRVSPRCAHVDVILSDTADAVAATYRESPLPGVPANVAVCFNKADGFQRLRSVSRADVVLIDPPFSPNAAADWRQLGEACCSLRQRNVPFLAWYPVFSETKPAELVNKTGCSGWEVIWARIGLKPSQNLKGCGVLASATLFEILQPAKHSFEVLASCLGGQFNERS